MSEIVDSVAQTVADFITDLDLDVKVTGYKWQRQSFDAPLPVGEVGIPTIGRIEPGGRESQMGTDDWELEFPVGLYFDLTEVVAAQAQAIDVVEAFIRAVDATPSLNEPTIEHASVVESEPEVLLEKPRALLVYRCRLELVKRVESAY